MAGNKVQLRLIVFNLHADLDRAQISRMQTKFRGLLPLTVEHHHLLTQLLLPFRCTELCIKQRRGWRGHGAGHGWRAGNRRGRDGNGGGVELIQCLRAVIGSAAVILLQSRGIAGCCAH